MTSSSPDEAYVWIWLPGALQPVVAGRLYKDSSTLRFNYGRSYLARDEAIAIYAPELPLQAGEIPLLPGMRMPGCIRDAAPDAWGRRVILNRLLGAGDNDDTERLDEMTYLLTSGSDRIGALDIQRSATVYEPREMKAATLDDLIEAAARVEAGDLLSPDLSDALFRGTSIGGARPKALIDAGTEKLIAKFSSSADHHDVVKGEFVAMRLARAVGLDVADVALQRVAGKDVLLVTRFDREARPNAWTRRALVSALTLFELGEMMARYASYEDLAEILRHRANRATESLHELFGRMVFNILCGNTDDHARNHAVFWDGHAIALTPAYDICPQARSGSIASQAMLISGEDRSSRIATCLKAAPSFLLDPSAAEDLVARQINGLIEAWPEVIEKAGLSEVETRRLWRRVFLNDFAFEGAPPRLRALLPHSAPT